MTREDILTNARWAGEVERYHTWPVHRRQSVAEHTWQLIRIYFWIWGAPSPGLMWFMMFHDAGELVTGDLPFPIKQKSKTLSSILADMEHDAIMAMDVEYKCSVTEMELDRAKVCDLIEMWEFGLAEQQRGNQYAQPIINDVWKAICARIQRIPRDEKRVCDYIRTSEKKLRGSGSCL